MTYGKHVNKKKTPQTEPLPGRTDMVKNQAGGYVFAVDPWQRLRRFLILGCEGGTYYQGEKELTLENFGALLECLKLDGARMVQAIVEVSDQALAPKNDPAIFALAVASVKGDEKARKAALDALPKVCRIGTHIFMFAEYREAIGGGWGRGARAAVGKWYTQRKGAALITQMLKYQQRNAWSHRDLLRLSHPKTEDPITKAIFEAVCAPVSGIPRMRPNKVAAGYTSKGWEALSTFPMVKGWMSIQKLVGTGDADVNPVNSEDQAAALIRDYILPRELVPTQLHKSAKVWEAMYPNLGYTALLRNLGNMSKCGLLAPMSAAAKQIAHRLCGQEDIQQSRVHPWAILLAARTYAQGKGFKGSSTWTVVPEIVEALDEAFDLAFKNIEPTGKRYLLGVDVSSSMNSAVQGSPITAAEAAGAMALITLRSEENVFAMGFESQFVDLKLSRKDSLNAILQKIRGRNFGSTDCAVPMQWALKSNVDVDVFVVYSDNETWSGQQHASVALDEYRRKKVQNAKFANVAFTATNKTLVEPKDAGGMNFVGLDSSMPQALSLFVRE